LVLLGNADLLGIVVDHLGEGTAAASVAAVCRTARRTVAAKRQEWRRATPIAFCGTGVDGAAFKRDRRTVGLFCHFVAGVDASRSPAFVVSDSMEGGLHLVRRNGITPLPCEVKSPFQVASDGSALYIADNGAGRLLKCTPGGKVLAASDDHTAEPLHGRPLSDPFGVALAPAPATARFGGASRVCFVTDRDAARCCAFDACDLRPLFAFGRPGSGLGELDDPCGCAYHDGVLYVCDRANARLVVFDVHGRPLRTIGGPCAGALCRGPGRFLGPSGVACARGHIFVVDSMGVRGKVLQVLSARYESARLWIKMPYTTRLVGVGATADAIHVCDMRSGAEGVLYSARWAGTAERELEQAAPGPRVGNRLRHLPGPSADIHA
jgi:hypothetical protein